MHAIALLIGALLAGGPRPPPAGPQERRLVLDQREGRRLELSRAAPAETTPPIEGALELVEGGSRGRLAERVGAAVLTPGGAVLFVRDGALVRLEGGRERTLVASGLAPELEIDPAGEKVALVRPTASGGSAILVLELSGAEGGAAVTVVAGPGYNNAPAFAPDGRTLLFVSTRTGLSSLFRVGLDGEGERQLTNRGLKAATGPGFVPPPERTAARRFEGGRYTWAADGVRWWADPATGAAGRAEGGAP